MGAGVHTAAVLHSPRCLSVHKVSCNVSQTLRETALALVTPPPVLTQVYQNHIQVEEAPAAKGPRECKLSFETSEFQNRASQWSESMPNVESPFFKFIFICLSVLPSPIPEHRIRA